mgnify:FL=1
MLKKRAIKRIITSTGALFIFLLIYIFPKQEKYSIPEEVIYVNELTMPLYTLDQNSYVARTNIIKKNEDDINYIVSVLTKNSINSNYLATNFSPIIPENTKLLDYSLNDNILKLNFSKELLNVSEKDEEKMIESLIYSLCEIKDVNKIMIFVEGKELNELPNSKIKLPTVLDKSFGVNKVYDVNNIKGIVKTTVYYMNKYDDNLYYVPITKITNSDKKCIEIIIDELKSSPTYESNLLSFLTASYELENYEILDNSISLTFNNKLLANLNDEQIIEKVKYSLALSIRDSLNIEDIVININ